MTGTHRGARTASGVGALAAVVAVLAVVAYSWLGTAAAVVGAVALAVGAWQDRRGVVRAGVTVLAAGVVLAGVEGAPPLAVGLGTWGALVAWDATSYATTVSDHVGDAAAHAVQLGHVRRSVLVGAAGLAVGALAFTVGTTGTAAFAGIATVAAVALALALALA